MFENMFEKFYKSDIYIIVPRKAKSEDWQGVLLGVTLKTNTIFQAETKTRTYSFCSKPFNFKIGTFPAK